MELPLFTEYLIELLAQSGVLLFQALASQGSEHNFKELEVMLALFEGE